MSTVVVRRYAGTGQRSQDDVLQMAAQELWPRIKSGCQRYTLVKFADNTIGSVSLYGDKAAAERATQTATEWVKNTGALAGYTLTQSMIGERVFGFHREGSLDTTHGVMRIYQSSASAQDVRRALEQEAQPILNDSQGLLRYTAFKAENEDRYVVLTAHQSRDSARQLTEAAQQVRQRSGSLVSQVFPSDPQLVEGVIVRSLTA